MPSMITHWLLAKRVLSHVSVIDKEAFLIGAQGPDLFFFFRAYPWLLGKSGFALGNVLHELPPGELFRMMRNQAAATDTVTRPIIDSYIGGFLCHYAVDRTVHPLILAGQEDIKEMYPRLAKATDPYHFYYESALDTLFLEQETGRTVSSFSLRQTLPKPSHERDEALAVFYESLLPAAVGERYAKDKLRHLTSDMRQSMFWMTDRVGIKRKLLRMAEVVLRRDATFSSLVRTTKLPNYDFFNTRHRPFDIPENGVCRDDFNILCDRTVSLAATLITLYQNGEDITHLIQNIGFAGRRTGK